MEPGRRLGTYEILASLGEGGMGEVYRARDTSLGREVAIKVLPEDFAADLDSTARFEREARLLASLNHPNIATIHGFETADGVRFLAMELVEGDTLGERIAATAGMELDEALEIAAQIAEGLEAAHETGIVHRDLKPANVKVTPEGHVKILDFGLAKALEAEGSVADSSPDLTQSPTRAAATQAGWILGTAAYMSPEQARGKPMDRRTDIWSFGCVLYEMLTGEPAFDGETATDVMAAIVRQEPDWNALPDSIPLPLRRLLRRCLEKDARQRLRDIGDARIELRELLRGDLEAWTPAGPGPSTDRDGATGGRGRPARSGPVAWRLGAVALAAAALGALATWLAGSGPTPPTAEEPVTRVSITLPDGQRQPRLLQSPLAITRDGSLLAYVARGGDDGLIRLYLRPLDSFESRAVPGSEGARTPFFSPDGKWIGFVSHGAIRKAPVDGGEPLRIVDASSVAFGASWGPDGSIVYARTINSGLWRVSAQGGEPEQLTRPDFQDGGYAHSWPQHLPDGRHVLYGVWGGAAADKVLDLETGEARTIRAEGDVGGPRILPTGHVIYADILGSGRLLAAPLDLETFTLRGQAVPVLDDVRYMDSQSAIPYLAVADNGTVVYASQRLADATVMWVDREGATTPIRTGPEIIAGMRLSPDGETAAYGDEQGGIWLLDVTRGTLDVAVRQDELFSMYPVWHPGGDRIVLTSNEAGSWNLYQVEVGARAAPEMLMQRDNNQYPASFSADGRLLAYVENHPETASDVWVLPDGEDPVAVARSPAEETQPAISPDGELIAYVSEERGHREVYVQRLPEGDRIDVSLEGGGQPVWARDGSELFFRRGDQLLKVDVSTAPRLTASRPQPLFEIPFEHGSGFGVTPHYDVSPDGERFLVVSDRPTTELKVIFNWFRELRERVPAGE